MSFGNKRDFNLSSVMLPLATHVKQTDTLKFPSAILIYMVLCFLPALCTAGAPLSFLKYSLKNQQIPSFRK